MWLWVKRIAVGASAVVIITLAFAYGTYEQRASKVYAVNVAPVAIPAQTALIDQGKHIAITRGCVECHGSDLGGHTFIDDKIAGTVSGTNLTRGKGGVGNAMTDTDWIRAIRHGLHRDSKPLLIMPAKEYWSFTDEDLGALIAYLKTVPPVDRALPPNHIALPLRVLASVNRDIHLFNAEQIDHASRPAPFNPANKIELGKYMAHGCTGCHGEGFGGGKIPGAPPDWIAPANLTPGGAIGQWSEVQFVATMRTGKTPEARQLNAERMPWPILGQMTDAELSALFAYLQSLPAKTTGTR
jgi:mono/diheme cytochrome c family protein